MRRRSATAEAPPDPQRLVEAFDYTAAAEVFIATGRFSRSLAMTYRRFPTAAAAIRYAIEEVPSALLIRATLEVSESRFDHQAIQTLYRGDAYPLRRKLAKSKGTRARSEPATGSEGTTAGIT